MSYHDKNGKIYVRCDFCKKEKITDKKPLNPFFKKTTAILNYCSLNCREGLWNKYMVPIRSVGTGTIFKSWDWKGGL